MKLLVTNADDFGLDPAINAAIAQAHTAGILTSASLLIGAAHVGPAIEFARAHPALGVGVHLCLVDGRPVAPRDKVAGLIDDTGALPPNPFALSVRLARRRDAEAAVETELRAQMEKFLVAGLQPTHLDTHQHTHIHPRVLHIVARLARAYGIAWVRGPVEPLWPSLQCDAHQRVRTVARWSVFGSFGARCARRLRQSGLRTADRAVGVLNAGQLSEEFLLDYLPRLADGVTEFVFHPATEHLRCCQPGYLHTGELQALCSPRVRQLAEDLGIAPLNFRQASRPR
jgi:hopanoid biosynthesis associated protein HpnK